jgi:glycosyltransferase involved in cell wall biosynthesis
LTLVIGGEGLLGEQPIRILFYSGHHEIVGGDARYLFDLVNRIDKEQFSVKICTDVNPVFTERATQWLQCQCPIDYLPTYPPLFQQRRFGRLTSHLIKEVTFQYLRDEWTNWQLFYSLFMQRRDTIDIFHFNNGGYPGKVAGLMAMLAAKAAGVRTVVMTVHNQPAKRSWRFPGHVIFDWLISKYCQETIAISEDIRQKLIAYRGYCAKKVKTINYGLDDLPGLSPKDIADKKLELGLPTDSDVILVSGNLEEERKGHRQLFCAMAKIIKKWPGVQLLVAGYAPPERMNYLRSYAENLGIAQAVHFLGYRTDIHELNCVSDIAVVPSVSYEGTPYTIKEASRAGKPVITTTAGSCADAVEDGVTGFIVPPYDIEALVAALAKLLSDKALRHELGRAGRKKFLQSFLVSHEVRKHEKMYLDRFSFLG